MNIHRREEEYLGLTGTAWCVEDVLSEYLKKKKIIRKVYQKYNHCTACGIVSVGQMEMCALLLHLILFWICVFVESLSGFRGFL